MELKKVGKSESFLQNQAALLPNERDGTSVKAFFSPAMCIGVRGETWLIFSRKARACNSWSATKDPFAFAAILRTQLTVGELSLNMAMCSPGCGSATASITNHNSNRPMHSRSEFVSFPFLPLLVLSTSSLMSCGHSRRNTVGIDTCLLMSHYHAANPMK